MKKYLLALSLFLNPVLYGLDNYNLSITKPVEMEIEGVQYKGRVRMIKGKDKTTIITEMDKNGKYEKINEMRDDGNNGTVDYYYSNYGSKIESTRDKMSKEDNETNDTSFANIKTAMERK